MGAILAQAQEELATYGNGTFLKWIENVGLSTTTAYRLINLHARFDVSTLERTTIATSALYLLSEPSTPPAAREQVIRRAEQGEAITHAEAREVVQEHLRRFEEEELRPCLHDAGNPEAPQMLTGLDEPLRPVPPVQQAQAHTSLRESIMELLDLCKDGKDADACTDEILDCLGQSSNSIAIAARFGAALAEGPKTLADLTSIAIEVSGVSPYGMEREDYLRWRKKALRLIDAIGCSDGLPIYQHALQNGQLVYGLLPPTE